MTGNEKIINRIRKLIALAQDAGASEGERDNATRMAHKTLAAYNLTMAEVEASGAGKGEARIDGEHQTIAHPWIRTVHAAIARLHFCEYFYIRHFGSKVTHHIIGRESNCVTAKDMALFLSKAIASEAGKRRRQEFLDGAWERDFCKGAAHALHRRCEQLRNEAEQEQQQSAGAPGTAIVLASLYATEKTANVALIAQLHGELKSGRGSRSVKSNDAYWSGREFGKGLSLNRQIAGGSTNNPRLK